MSKGSLSGAYVEGGYVLGNPRNQWSAFDEKNGRVALTVWSDQIDRSGALPVIDTSNGRPISDWGHRVGNKVRIRHIAWALQNAGGWVDLILLRAKTPITEPRTVEGARFWEQVRGHISSSDFNPETGNFRVVIHPRPS